MSSADKQESPADNQKIQESPQPAADERPSDEQLLAYEREIRAPHMAAPCIGPRADFAQLAAEFAGGETLLAGKLAQLQSPPAGTPPLGYAGVRHVRKDGNCFYRAIAFRLAELAAEERARGGAWAEVLVDRVRASRAVVAEAGYDLAVVEDFYEPLELLLSQPGNGQAVQEAFNVDYQSDTLVCYLRILTAAVLKRDRELYEAFVLDAYPTLDDFIAAQVEPMAVEADQVQMVVLANALGVSLRVANLDASPGPLNYHAIDPMEPTFAPDEHPQYVVHLLFRPGHYDVLYPQGA